MRGAALILWTAVLAAALVAAVAAPSAPASTHHRAVALTSLERGVLADINAFRAANHLGPLRVSASLTEAARRHSQQMEADGYFAHNSFDGTAFWKRIKAFYPSGGYGFWKFDPLGMAGHPFRLAGQRQPSSQVSSMKERASSSSRTPCCWTPCR